MTRKLTLEQRISRLERLIRRTRKNEARAKLDRKSQNRVDKYFKLHFGIDSTLADYDSFEDWEDAVREELINHSPQDDFDFTVDTVYERLLDDGCKVTEDDKPLIGDRLTELAKKLLSDEDALQDIRDKFDDLDSVFDDIEDW